MLPEPRFQGTRFWLNFSPARAPRPLEIIPQISRPVLIMTTYISQTRSPLECLLLLKGNHRNRKTAFLIIATNTAIRARTCPIITTALVFLVAHRNGAMAAESRFLPAPKLSTIENRDLGCEGTMPALEAGVQAPEIELQYLDGRKFSLKEERKKGPVVAVFFKVSCPVCHMALPYLERIFKAYEKNGNL